jgi:cation:H+ antiporter
MSGAMICVGGLTLLTAPLTGDTTFLGIGPGLWVLAIIYIGGIRIVYLDQRVSATEAVADPQHVQEPTGSLKAALTRFVAAAIVILVVGPFMAHAAENIAKATGIGRTFVGTTMVALSTSLPEFVASLAAVRMGAYDLAIGNVFGSNAFNMFLLVPLDAVQSGALMARVSMGHGITCLSAILATQTAIMGQLYNVEGRRRLIDLDAWLVIGIVLGGLALVYYSA